MLLRARCEPWFFLFNNSSYYHMEIHSWLAYNYVFDNFHLLNIEIGYIRRYGQSLWICPIHQKCILQLQIKFYFTENVWTDICSFKIILILDPHHMKSIAKTIYLFIFALNFFFSKQTFSVALYPVLELALLA